MRGFFKRLGEIWGIIGMSLLLLFLVELFFRIFLLFSSNPDPRASADCYQGAEWVDAYYSEFAQCNESQWEPYVYWKRQPFSGEFIGVDDRGIRKSVTKSNPLSRQFSGATIYFFGGSALWGTGARDAYTIPSLTGNELIRHGISPTLFNYGESGYVSSQEVIRLTQELKQGNIPDVVVFYSGVNDIFSSYQAGQAGIPQNESNRRKEFNTLKEKKKSLSVFLSSLKTLSTIKFLNRKFGGDKGVIPERTITDIENLASQTALYYNENIRMVNALAKEYGFYALFYWQPTLFGKPFRTAYEEEEAEKAKHLLPLLEAVNNQLFTDDLAYENIRFYNLTGFFSAVKEPLYIDWCHIGENGNQMIAERMAKDILPALDSLHIKRDKTNE